MFFGKEDSLGFVLFLICPLDAEDESGCAAEG